MPELGDPAPEITLPRDGGGTVSLSDFAGRPVVLYFYPRASTSGCTKQASGFTELMPRFEAAGATVLGVSKDPVGKLDRFRDKYELGVTLLSDEESHVCEDYGVWQEKKMYGKAHMGIVRTTFLIGADGKIAQIWPKVKVDGHVQAVLDAVEAL